MWDAIICADGGSPVTHDNNSLLAHLTLSGRFHLHHERREDLAVEALGYILSTSTAAMQTLTQTLRIGGAEVGQLTNVQTQVSADEGGRPDLVAFDSEGRESVLIEAKFWAGLTANQPNRYLDGLPTDIPSVLLFVAPEARFETLWQELRRSAMAEFSLGPDVEKEGVKSTVTLGSRRHIMLISWRSLLRNIKNHSPDMLEDVRQLEGLCEMEDAQAFLPLEASELGPAFPRRMRHLIRLIPNATGDPRLSRYVKWISSKMNSAINPHVRQGRYLWFGDVPVWFGIDYHLWAQRGDTPLWVVLRDTEFEGAATIREIRRRAHSLPRIIDSGSDLWIPVYLPTGVEERAVLKAVVDRLCEVAEAIKRPPGRPRKS